MFFSMYRQLGGFLRAPCQSPTSRASFVDRQIACFYPRSFFSLQDRDSPGTKPPLLSDHSGIRAHSHFEINWSNSANPMFQLEFAINDVIIPVHAVKMFTDETWV